MSVIIRMKRVGVKKKPYYRIVVVDARKRETGKVLEILGQYDPRKAVNSEKITVDKERVIHWLSCGAVPSGTVSSFLSKIEGISIKKKWIKKKLPKKSKKPKSDK
ncbi:30S ribosomal protein S16 [bacterium]|nr:30S ribosomal protein S16 [bacterium]